MADNGNEPTLSTSSADNVSCGDLVSFDTSASDQFDFADDLLDGLANDSGVDAEETMFRIISAGDGDGQFEGLVLFRLSGDYDEDAAYLDDVFAIDPPGGDPVAGPATEAALLLALVAA